MSSEFERVVARLLAADVASAEIDALVAELRPLTKGVKLDVPRFRLGMPMYRGRIAEHAEMVRDLSYPPVELTRLGRLNRPNQPLFYACAAREAVFFEVDALVGASVLLSTWRTTAPMLVNHVGYHKESFDALGSARGVAGWDGVVDPHAKHPESAGALSALSQLFAQRVERGSEERYRLSVAVAECFLSPQFAGLLWPSVAMMANADNLALRPAWVDENVAFVHAERVFVEAKEGRTLRVRVTHDATAPNGVDLVWKAREAGDQ